MNHCLDVWGNMRYLRMAVVHTHMQIWVCGCEAEESCKSKSMHMTHTARIRLQSFPNGIRLVDFFPRGSLFFRIANLMAFRNEPGVLDIPHNASIIKDHATSRRRLTLLGIYLPNFSVVVFAGRPEVSRLISRSPDRRFFKYLREMAERVWQTSPFSSAVQH